jgi:UDP-2,3-diacylglucosamine hydrolase
MKLTLAPGKKVYFASDFHLGAPDPPQSREREHKIIRWLDMVRHDAAHVFLMGDLFDFWFEFRTVIPKGFVRFQAKVAELTDAGIPVRVFTGNHDMWMWQYLEEEIGVEVYRDPVTAQIGHHSFYLAHGDGLGPGDPVYKVLKRVFESPFFRALFRIVHPDIGIWIAHRWSASSRKKNAHLDEGFLGENEWLWQYSKEQEAQRHHDFYVFGHRHLPLDLKVGECSRYINLGEWIRCFTYAAYDGQQMELLTFEKPETAASAG